jgi:hypothetical protein
MEVDFTVLLAAKNAALEAAIRAVLWMADSEQYEQ